MTLRFEYWRKNLLYLIFLLVAAPLQFYFAAAGGWVEASLSAGTLYFFAVIVAADTLYRIENDNDLTDSFSITCLRLACLLTFGVFIAECLPHYIALQGNTPDIDSSALQIGLAIIATFCSLVVHAYLTWIDLTKKRLSQSG